jgi:type VI secretion system protein ImpA
MSVEDWLTATDVEPPCGPELEYDEAFLEFQRASTGKPEQQYGDTIIPAEEPDWRQVERLAGSLLARTKDLRIVAPLARARANLGGLAQAGEVVRFARLLLEQHWDEVHPSLSVDGEFDPFVRISAVAALGEAGGLIRDLRNCELMRSALGSLTVRAAEAILAGKGGEAGAISADQMRAALTEAVAAKQEAPLALPSLVDDLRGIQAVFRDRLDPSSMPDLVALLLPLETLGKLVASVVSPGGADGEGAMPATAAAGAGESGSMVVGAIRDRESAILALERVCEYLERSEPSNPAPLLIRRAQRLMRMGFLDIIRDMVPDSMGQIESIAGTRSEG